ncbi:hypothetical protein EV363DRAFT_1301345 [Boletus edulis]|nr:hypothetical protein EV363DRAFT_1301345 [Boletus edulis]
MVAKFTVPINCISIARLFAIVLPPESVRLMSVTQFHVDNLTTVSAPIAFETSMEISPPPISNLDEIKSCQDAILANFMDPSDHLTGILFAAGHEAPILVTVPFEKGILRLDYWVHDPRLINYYITHTDMSFVGVRRKTFKQYPLGSDGVPFEHAYSVFYLAQGVEVPINHALLKFCAGAADHRLIRGNVMVLKHRQSSAKKFEDTISEDMGLVCSMIGTAAVHGKFQNVNPLDLAMDAPIEL